MTDPFPQKGWSFGIVTDGSCPDRVDKVIESIRFAFQFVKSPFEIFVIGAEKSETRGEDVLCIEFDETIKPGWITRKKNFASECAKYDKLCLLHDYVALGHNWALGFERFGDDWNSVVTPIYNTNGRYFRYWCTADHDAGVDMGDDQEGKVPFRNMRVGLKGYARWQYFSGAYFCVKTEIMHRIPLNEELVWAQSEDIEWSRRMFLEFGEEAFSCNSHSFVKFLKEKPHAPWENLNCL